MSTFRQGQHVVYQPGFLGTNLSEEGRTLPDRQRKVVHGVVERVSEEVVFINADCPEDSGDFPSELVEHDHSGDPLF